MTYCRDRRVGVSREKTGLIVFGLCSCLDGIVVVNLFAHQMSEKSASFSIFVVSFAPIEGRRPCSVATLDEIVSWARLIRQEWVWMDWFARSRLGVFLDRYSRLGVHPRRGERLRCGDWGLDSACRFRWQPGNPWPTGLACWRRRLFLVLEAHTCRE